MKKICAVAYTYYLSDPRVRREAEALAQRGDQVCCICLDDSERDRQIRGVRLYRIPLRRYRGTHFIFYMASYVVFFGLASLVLTFLTFWKGLQIVHVHTMPDFMVFASALPRLLGVKVILDIHDTMPELYAEKFDISFDHPLIRIIKQVEVLSAQFAHRVITVSEPVKNLLATHGIPPAKIAVLMNLADDSIFYPRVSHRKSEETFRLMYHGTVTRRHGIDVALQAVAQVRQDIPKIRFDVYGNGDYLTEAMSLSSRLGLDGCVFFNQAFIPIEELPDRIEGADVGIVPIRNDRATRYMLPVKLLEYLAMEKPTVVSRIEVVEYYMDCATVEFAEPENPQSLAEGIKKLYYSVERRAELKANARRFKQRYCWSRQKETFFKVIDDVSPVKVCLS
ncbi:MAG: hypothetical protein A3F84_23015 [Candidatus Handelsmanbacteria bacterium RIFCSPLOWO2_12_FULL_64_10]|uniref:Glycosyltransferase subfamily 4-like N-terminal domain-containing protein n=1 Tax=Handelsmanbacteria sp. (strain RIFCSPLOWO2_12_FULL_64_10) TaxID=1817868 RepID=A0A1F6CH12_HANXR|nr:MAG: hypothetical protein A3F84_23015 [Candidatus Handelsmanbacteria bacterium RIFCSPLOWO2_12_FULL_64_10]